MHLGINGKTQVHAQELIKIAGKDVRAHDKGQFLPQLLKNTQGATPSGLLPAIIIARPGAPGKGAGWRDCGLGFVRY